MMIQRIVSYISYSIGGTIGSMLVWGWEALPFCIQWGLVSGCLWMALWELGQKKSS